MVICNDHGSGELENGASIHVFLDCCTAAP